MDRALSSNEGGRACKVGIEPLFRRFVRTLWPAFLAALVWTAQPAAAQPATSPAPRAEPPPGNDPLRAAIEDLVINGLGVVWYLIDDRNVLDWDLTSIDERFSIDSYRFDNNGFPINFMAHPISGSLYYAIPRWNGLHMSIANLYGIVSSFLWEFVIEFKERFSINDSMVTSLGGMAIGEPFFRLTQLVEAYTHPALAWTLGFPLAAHEALDGRRVGVEGERLPEPIGWHRIRLSYAGGWAETGSGESFDMHTLRVALGFAVLPDVGRVGTSMGYFLDAEVSSLRVDGNFSSTGTGVDVWGDAYLVGGYFSHLEETRIGSRFGGNVILGTSIGHFYRWEDYDEWSDRFAFSGFPGVAVDADAVAGPLTIRASGRLHLGFGGAHAASFPAWRRVHTEQVPKTILENHGYYYGWGWMGLASLELSASLFSVGGTLAYIALDSQEGLDRRQDVVTYDIDVEDALLELAGFVRVSLPYGLFFEASARTHVRRSVLDGVASQRSLSRYQLALGMHL